MLQSICVTNFIVKMFLSIIPKFYYRQYSLLNLGKLVAHI